MPKSLYHPIDIGPLRIDGNLFLAPLAGYTDRSFRSICIDYGANFTFTEMVSGEGLARESENTEKLLLRADNEELLGVQLFMSDASVAKRAMENLLRYNPSLIDLNCGCPVPKVVKTEAGSALMKNPEKIFNIVKSLKNSCDIPVSVKIRVGWDLQSINYRETADAALEGGVDMISMHARTRSMGYSGSADWQTLKDLKEYISKKRVEVPLFGSGDLFTPQSALQMLATTGVDGVMFARGAMGNPFIFEQTKALLLNSTEPEPISIEKRISTLLSHLSLLIKDQGEKSGCTEMRKHAGSYLKGVPHSGEARQALVQANMYEEYERVCFNLLERVKLG